MWRSALTCMAAAALLTGCAGKEKPTHFSYAPEEMHLIDSLPESYQSLTNQKLTKTNEIAYRYIDTYAVLSEVDKVRFYPYLAVAQHDFALLSDYKGTFAPVTHGIVQLFNPGAEVPQFETADWTSMEIARVVVEKARERYERENERLRDYKVRRGINLWKPTFDYEGLNFGSLQPWHLVSCKEFRCAKPDLDRGRMGEQARSIREEMKVMTARKFNAIHYWERGGDWEMIAEEYMRSSQVPLEKRLTVRADLLTGTSDAKGSAFDSKYSYWVQRPTGFDPTISEVINPSSTPSYPSTNSAIGFAAATILSSHFPENSQQWNLLAEESGMSGIWAGIHFPMDHEQGALMGERIGFRVVGREN